MLVPHVGHLDVPFKMSLLDLGTLGSKQDVSIKSLPSGHRESCRRRGRKNVRARGDRGHQESKASKSAQSKLT